MGDRVTPEEAREIADFVNCPSAGCNCPNARAARALRSLADENERLRANLNRIAHHEPAPRWDGWREVQCLQDIARAALGEDSDT